MNRSLLRDYAASLRRPEFWVYATWLGLVTKYRRSRLGMLWAFLPPALYAFGVGGFFANIQGTTPQEFIPHLAVGYIVFRFVVVSLSEATTACTGNVSFILDGRVRLTDYVLQVIAKAAFYFMLAIPVALVALSLTPSFQWIGVLTLIPALLAVVLNVAWMGSILSVVGARLPDVHELMGSVLMFSFLFTPIIWTAEQAPADSLRGSVARINPLFHMVEVVRAPILGEPIERLSLLYLGIMLVVGWFVAVAVYRRYARFVPIWL